MNLYRDIDSGKVQLTRKIARVLQMTLEHEAFHVEVRIILFYRAEARCDVLPDRPCCTCFCNAPALELSLQLGLFLLLGMFLPNPGTSRPCPLRRRSPLVLRKSVLVTTTMRLMITLLTSLTTRWGGTTRALNAPSRLRNSRSSSVLSPMGSSTSSTRAMARERSSSRRAGSSSTGKSSYVDSLSFVCLQCADSPPLDSYLVRTGSDEDRPALAHQGVV